MSHEIAPTNNRLFARDLIGLYSVCFSIVWPMLHNWLLSFDGGGRMPVICIITSCCLLFHDIKTTSLKKPLIIYVFVAIYMMINGLLMGSAAVYPKGGTWLICTHILCPVGTMLITAYLAQKNWLITIKGLIVALIIYTILALQIGVIGENGRLTSDINANEIALTSVVCFGLLLLSFLTIKKRLVILCCMTVPITVIFLTGSRMAFFMTLLMFSAATSTLVNLKKPKNILLLLFIVVIAIWGFNFILENTVIGERILSTTEQGQSEKLSTGTILDYYGDRGFQYYASWPFFLEHPIFGIGFHQWILHSPTGHVCHSEYMVQYVECGLASFIPYMFFLIILIRTLLKCRKNAGGKSRITLILLLSFMFSIVYSNSVLWSYNQHPVFILFALCYAYPQIIKKSIYSVK